MRRVGRVNRGGLGECPSVKDVHLSSKVTEAGKGDQSTLRVEGDEVVWRGSEIVETADALVEQHRLGRHIYEPKSEPWGSREKTEKSLHPYTTPNSFALGLQAKS